MIVLGAQLKSWRLIPVNLPQVFYRQWTFCGLCELAIRSSRCRHGTVIPRACGMYNHNKTVGRTYINGFAVKNRTGIGQNSIPIS